MPERMNKKWQEHTSLSVAMQKGIVTLEDIWGSFKELNLLLQFGPVIKRLDIRWKELKTYVHTKS